MKIGIVIHGPNIIDSGYASQIIYHLSNLGDVHCRLGGTMGRTAVIDANLENLIDISSKLLPSGSVKLFKEDPAIDRIFLINYGKSSITGHTFGYKVFKNSFLDNNENNNKNNDFNMNNSNIKQVIDENQKKIPFIQIERPGEVDGSIIQWNGESKEIISKIAKIFNLNIISPETIIKKYFSNNCNSSSEELDKFINSDDYINSSELNHLDTSGIKIRKIQGANPNENIFLNGIVIGKTNSKNLAIISKNNHIVEIVGGTKKDHGIEKLGKINIDKAIVKTGLLRKSNPNPRIIDIEEINNIKLNSSIFNSKLSNRNENLSISKDLPTNTDFLNIAFIDHAAEDIYKLNHCDLVVTIGDDTTLLASDILYRFNIPVIGITDGDLDKVVESGFKSHNSMIVEVKEGFDDIVGEAIFNDIFNKKDFLEIPYFISSSSEISSDINQFNHTNNNSTNSTNTNSITNTTNAIKVIKSTNTTKINNNTHNYNKDYNYDIKEKEIDNFKKKILKIVNNISPNYQIDNIKSKR